jgi:peptide deformylase
MPITQAGDPILRRPARPIATGNIRSTETRRLIEALHHVLSETSGVGLAAPQIGVGLRAVVIQDRLEYLAAIPPERLVELDRAPIQPYALINPRLELLGGRTRTFFEGCLSVDGYRALVARHDTVRVQYCTPDGELRTENRTGWHARILQHELDHLDGVLYVDRMLSRSFMTVAKYEHWMHQPTDAVLAAFGIDDGVP